MQSEQVYSLSTTNCDISMQEVDKGTKYGAVWYHVPTIFHYVQSANYVTPLTRLLLFLTATLDAAAN